MPQFGPGTFEVGAVGDKLQVSCLINSLTITSDKDQGDSTTKLCGTVRPGPVTYTYSLSGNVDLDSDDAEGLFALSQAAKGSVLPFTFTPSATGTVATGAVTIDPLDFGGDEFGADMTSDFEWALVGEPVYEFPEPAETAQWWTRLVLAPEPDAANTSTPAPEPENESVPVSA